MNKNYKMGHRQAMTSAGLILRWIDKPNAIGFEQRKFIRNLLENKTVEQFDKYKIEAFRVICISIVEEATTDYFEECISFKDIAQTLRITKALYDVLNGLSLMEVE